MPHLHFTWVVIAPILNRPIWYISFHISGQLARTRLMLSGARPRAGPHKNVGLVQFPAASPPPPPSIPWRRWGLVMKFSVLGFLGWWAFSILGSFRGFLNFIHGVLQLRFDHNVFFWALFHLPHRHDDDDVMNSFSYWNSFAKTPKTCSKDISFTKWHTQTAVSFPKLA